jgi:PIN domain nuclease of toxin-antitoxin system
MMRLLFDTNTLLWYFWGSKRLEPVLDLIQLPDTEVFISAVSWWEMAIKVRIGKLPVDLAELRSRAEKHGFHELPLYGRAADALITLPKLRRGGCPRNDPFDHMLLAQAITEPMRFITGDGLLADYSSLVMVI